MILAVLLQKKKIFLKIEFLLKLLVGNKAQQANDASKGIF